MCGITGYIGWPTGAENMQQQLKRMAGTLISRGPDSAGYWCNPEYRVALAHRRLAIVDLSTAGHQPMVSFSGRYVITFNGEIYNHLDLRKQLATASAHPINWRGHSDTETLMAGIEIWGLDETLKKSIGMFAFALWDQQDNILYLARDRVGEKPLYYGYQQGVFLFGSELKALKAHPAFAGEIDRNAITLQLRHNYISAPYSIYKGIKKLLPGSFLKLKVASDHSIIELPEPTLYWSLQQVINIGFAQPFTDSDADAIAALDHLLRTSVKQQMVADVPLGAFLSGGVDSSTIVALMQAQSPKPIKTFSIGFNEAAYNEAEYAKAVAQHLGTDHTELYVSPQQTIDVIPRLPLLYDEPFSDSSQIPTFLVAAMTRQHVTVSLSGDAGDELFAGYNRYLFAHRLWTKLSCLPKQVRHWVASTLTLLSPDQWSKLFAPVQSLMPPTKRLVNPGDKLHKGAGVLGCDSLDTLYLRLVSHWENPSSLVIGGDEPETLLTAPNSTVAALNGIERMMALDTLTYLPGDILVKIDRAAMGVSLETRVPFLDHRVLEFAWRLPLAMKIRSGQGKWLLRQVLYKYVPQQLIERPKMGFGVPIDIWLRGPLHDWAESLLDESRLRHEGFLNPIPIRQKWLEHLSGQRNWQYQLWDILMFQAWLEHQSKRTVTE